jgi:outer membrane receptor protein involved in Fe transport
VARGEHNSPEKEHAPSVLRLFGSGGAQAVDGLLGAGSVAAFGVFVQVELVFLDGFGRLLGGFEREGGDYVDAGESRVRNAVGFARVGDGLIVVVGEQGGVGGGGEGPGVEGIGGKRFVEEFESFVVFLLGEGDASQIALGFGEVGVEADGFFKCGACLRQAAAAGEGSSEAIVGDVVVRIERDSGINSHLVISAHYGYFYYKSEDRGLPSGIRYIYNNDLVGGTTTSPVTGAVLIPVGSANASFAHQTGFANIANNITTQHDIYSRKSLMTDVSYSVSKWGQHNFKFGYGNNRLANDVFQGTNTALVNVFYGNPYTASTPAGQTECGVIASDNAAAGGAAVCSGTAGYFTVRDGPTTIGKASSYNHGIYGQDSWSVGHGLTLNLGVRFDKEFLPAYSPGNPSIDFGFTQKVAPRIGGAYDVLHNGKLKLFASYGKFFDIMKYSLPRGSFGGDYWHDCVYAMDFIDFNTITPSSPGGHGCGPTFDPAAGVTVGRFIENINWRAPAGNATDPGVDPNLKPMSQHEFLVGTDWAISPKMGLEVRYARKRLDHTIDDMSIDDSTYYIGNPGPNTYADLLHRALPAAGYLAPVCPQCPLAPAASRRYDGLETRLTYRGSKLTGLVTYTYSRLYGNFSGLTDTDVTDASGGRHNANNNRTFDLPEMQYTTTGKVADGPLGTDRPNVLNMSGYYTLRWFGMQTSFGVIQTIAQGSPKSTCVPVVDSTSSCQFFGDSRGTFANLVQDPTTGVFTVASVEKDARMPFYTQTDFSLNHSFHVSKTHEQMRLGLEFNAQNLLNQHAVLSVNPNPFGRGTEFLKFADASPTGVDVTKFLTGYDTAAEATAQGGMVANSRYGLPFLFQGSRNLRLGIRFMF